MKTFTNILEAKGVINYVRNVIFEENNGTYYDFESKKTEKYDQKIIDANTEIIEVIYTNISTEVGKTVFTVITYDEHNENVVYAFNNVFDAIGKALDFFIKAKDRKVDYYGVKVFKQLVTSGSKNNSWDAYSNPNHILQAQIIEDKNIEEILIVPEYGNNPKVKNIMLSLDGINKFKL